MKLDLQFFGGRGANSASSSGADGVPFRKGKEKTPEEAVLGVNADNYNKGREYQENCQRCIWAYEMQRRGYDVEALPAPKGDTLCNYGNWMDIAQNTLTKEWIGVHYGQTKSNKTVVANATETMRGWGEGSRGIIRVAWSGRSYGHVFNVEYKNGKVIGYDAQSGKTYTNLTQALKGARLDFTQIIRSDNVTFRTGEISKYVKERGKK